MGRGGAGGRGVGPHAAHSGLPWDLAEVLLAVGCMLFSNGELNSRKRQDQDPALASGVSEDRLGLGKVEPWDTDVGAAPPESVAQSEVRGAQRHGDPQDGGLACALDVHRELGWLWSMPRGRCWTPSQTRT